MNRPGRSADLTGEESDLARGLLEHFDRAGLNPPSPSELRESFPTKPQILEGVLRYLQERGKLARLPGDLVLARSAVDTVRGQLVESDWESFTVGDFKQRFGLTRKWAIPLLEHLDSVGATRRAGDKRVVVRSSR